MSDIAASSFVRQELVPERAAPVKTTGFIGFLRTRLFNSPTNILLTLVSALLLWFTVNPLTMWLTLATFVGYAVVYTVLLKPATPQNIVIGGASGAMPPVTSLPAKSTPSSIPARMPAGARP